MRYCNFFDIIRWFFLSFGFFLCHSIFCQTPGENSFTVEGRVVEPVEGERAVLVSLENFKYRELWQIKTLEEGGRFRFEDSIQEPTFYHFQLGRTPVMKTLIVEPGNSISLEINGESIGVISNEDQLLLDSLDGLMFELSNEEFREFVKSSLGQSPVLVRAMNHWSYDNEMDKDIREIILGYIKQRPNEKLSKELEDRFNSLNRIAIGASAPELNLPDPNDKIVSLGSLNSKYILIDFWGTWCKPCIATIPKLKEIYSKFSDKNFEILSVAFDSKDKWLGGIDKYELSWTNVLDEDGKIAELYGVRSYPAYFLIDQSGEIIKKGLKNIDLELEKILK